MVMTYVMSLQSNIASITTLYIQVLLGVVQEKILKHHGGI
jgi:hypothetical protein